MSCTDCLMKNVSLSGAEIQALLDAAEYAADKHSPDYQFHKQLKRAIGSLSYQSHRSPEYYVRNDRDQLVEAG